LAKIILKIPFFDLSSEISKHKGEILKNLERVLDDGQFVGGKYVELFERDFAEFSGARFCVGVGNGLDAIRLILEALEIGPGDEVIVPSFTFYATWLAVMQVGATPVFVDVEASSASIDPLLLEGALSSKTKAIIVVHLFGVPSDMAAISMFANRNGLKVIEDCAQAHGATIAGKPVGTFGIAGAYSFYPTKNLGALGDAGAIVTDDSLLTDKSLSRRSYGQGATKYDHVDSGWNTRLDTLQAAILSVNLALLPSYNTRRREIARHYLDALDVRAHHVVSGQIDESVWHHFVVKAQNRERFRDYMAGQGVATDIHYPYCSSSTPAVTKYLSSLGGPETSHSQVALELSKTVVSLPIGPWMTDGQVEYVAQVLRGLPSNVLG